MNLLDTLAVVIVTNAVGFTFTYYNFRIRLEGRLATLETKVDLLLKDRGISFDESNGS